VLYDAIAGSNGFYNSPVDPGAHRNPVPPAAFGVWGLGFAEWEQKRTCRLGCLGCCRSVPGEMVHAPMAHAPCPASQRSATLPPLPLPAPSAAVRSLMNVPFTIPSNPDLEKEFIAQAAKQGMVGDP